MFCQAATIFAIIPHLPDKTTEIKGGRGQRPFPFLEIGWGLHGRSPGLFRYSAQPDATAVEGALLGHVAQGIGGEPVDVTAVLRPSNYFS